jgi:hypothetical protein
MLHNSYFLANQRGEQTIIKIELNEDEDLIILNLRRCGKGFKG